MGEEKSRLLPSGTVTFLFTDMERSTVLLQGVGEQTYSQLLEDHHKALRTEFERHDGIEFGSEGEGFAVVFRRAGDAIAAALAGQLAILRTHPEVKVRMGIHTGDATVTTTGYIGLSLHQAARISAAGHGGQILISDATRHLVGETNPPEGTHLIDLGEHRLKDLAAPIRIYQLGHYDLPDDFPPIRSLDARAHNLPIQLTGLVGREKEIDDVTKLVAANRLVTLSGAAGCGKTRLALHVAAELLDQYADGVWLAELADTSDSEMVPRRVAEAVGLRFESAGFEEAGELGTDHDKRLEQYLRPKNLLLVLDNCEHLLSSTGQLTQSLLRSCPGVRVLATSREPLGVGGESAFRVPSLDVPDAKHPPPTQELTNYDSVRLFVERAHLIEPSFQLTDDYAQAVAHICARLDGMPLGIELAAAKVRILTPQQIAARLDEMFGLLTGGGRTALERQQTLRAAVDWSYRLLTEPERLLLQRLSVFVGGFELEATEEVCSGEGIERRDVLDLLTHLLDASFVTRQEHRRTSRYRLLETIRQYAREKLFESEKGSESRNRHRDFYLRLAEQASDEQFGGDLTLTLQIEKEESDNLLAALDWSLTAGDADEALRMCCSLTIPWVLRGRWLELYKWFEAALAMSAGQETRARADALGDASWMAVMRGEPGGLKMGEEAVAIARRLGDPSVLGRALAQLGGTATVLPDPQLAVSAFDEAIPILRQTEQHWWTAFAPHGLGLLAISQGEFDEAQSQLEKSLSYARGHQIQFMVLESSRLLGYTQLRRGDYEGAKSSYLENLAIAQELAITWQVIRSLIGLGEVAQAQGNSEEATSLFERALAEARQSGEPRRLANAYEGLRRAALARGSYEEARKHSEDHLAVLRGLDAGGVYMTNALNSLGWVATLQGDFAAARPLLEESLALARNIEIKDLLAEAIAMVGALNRFEGKTEAAQRLHEESLAIAREVGSKPLMASILWGLGELARVKKDYRGALDLHREALRLFQALGHKENLAHSLQALGGLAALTRRPREACRLFGAAEQLCNVAGSVMSPVLIPGYERDVEQARSALTSEEFDAEWARGRGMSQEEAVNYALTVAVVSP